MREYNKFGRVMFRGKEYPRNFDFDQDFMGEEEIREGTKIGRQIPTEEENPNYTNFGHPIDGHVLVWIQNHVNTMHPDRHREKYGERE